MEHVTTTAAPTGRTEIGQPPVPAPPRLRRRPIVTIASAAVVVAGAVLAAWAWTATTNTTVVLVARDTILRGSVIEADDVTRASVGLDPAVRPLVSSDLVAVVGSRAALDIAAGSLLTADAVSDSLTPPAGMSVVGVTLPAPVAPGLPLQPGDRVRIVVTSPDAASVPSPSEPRFHEGDVVGVTTDPATGQTVVDVQVPHAEALTFAEDVATGKVTLVLDARER